MLERNPSWTRWEQALHDRIRALGVRRWRPFPEITRNISAVDGPNDRYDHYARQCSSLLWPDEPPETIVEFGAGFGGMIHYWPQGATVINIDIDPMLQIQDHYIHTERRIDRLVVLLRPEEAVKIDWSKVHFFSAFAFTETRIETWRYYMEHIFPKVRGAYITGSRGWKDGPAEWPWDDLSGSFEHVVVNRDKHLFHGMRREFCGINNHTTSR